jgi:exodeoxyribonuclease V alpha subunit
MDVTIERLRELGEISPLDVHFARLMARIGGGEIAPAAAMASARTREGHVCLDLVTISGEQPLTEDKTVTLRFPEIADWLDILGRSPAVGRPGEYRPLILDQGRRLYLHRYWAYQEALAAFVRERSAEAAESPDPRALKEDLDRLFPSSGADAIDWQKIAAFAASDRKFCVITGGPGTGKTTTVGRLLALLIRRSLPQKLHVALAAPTGKAAARLQEAIVEVKSRLPFGRDVIEAIPTRASTIHRLLGARSDSPRFRHTRENPLSADVVVVDEASMIDLPLTAKLVQALRPQARLILLGDKDQLSSVEAGAVLADLCGGRSLPGFSTRFLDRVRDVAGCDMRTLVEERNDTPLADCIVELQTSRRFGPDSGIAALSRAVREGDAAMAEKVSIRGGFPDLERRDLPDPRTLGPELKAALLEGYAEYLRAETAAEALARFQGFRVLCALRRGPYGVEALNAAVENALAEAGLIDPGAIYYRGRPVMVVANDYHLRLFNGDVGLVWPSAEAGGELRVHFPVSDGGLRALHPVRLPKHETVFAMTVHKSQGSEFDRIMLILPDRDAPVLTRELVYTGLTRAVSRASVYTKPEVFRAAVERRIERSSGLRDSLWVSEPSLYIPKRP